MRLCNLYNSEVKNTFHNLNSFRKTKAIRNKVTDLLPGGCRGESVHYPPQTRKPVDFENEQKIPKGWVKDDNQRENLSSASGRLGMKERLAKTFSPTIELVI